MPDDLPPKSYYTGLLDSLSRVQFNIRRHSDDTFSTRPSLRIRHRDNEILISLIGELLESKNIDFDLISRDYGYNYFHLNRRGDLKMIHKYIDNKSTQLIRELAFVHGPYQGFFDSASNSPKKIYQLVQAIEDLHFGRRLSPKTPYPKPEELASEFNIDTSCVKDINLPVGNFREEYPVEYIGGIVDALAYFRTNINKSPYGIGYNMVPQINIHKGGVHPAFAASVETFCDERKLQYNSASDMHTLNTIINGADAIDNFAPQVGPYLVVQHDELAYLHEEFIPRFYADEHHTKQGFYDLLVDFQVLGSTGRIRERSRKFTPEFFEKKWDEEIEIHKRE
jgi:hypothetical protein